MNQQKSKQNQINAFKIFLDNKPKSVTFKQVALELGITANTKQKIIDKLQTVDSNTIAGAYNKLSKTASTNPQQSQEMFNVVPVQKLKKASDDTGLNMPSADIYRQGKQFVDDSFNDSRLQSKVPQLKQIQKLHSDGKISLQQSKQQQAQAVQEAMKSNKTVKPLIKQMIIQKIKNKNEGPRATAYDGFTLNSHLEEEEKINVSGLNSTVKSGQVLDQRSLQGKAVVNKSTLDVNDVATDIPQSQIKAPEIGSDTKELHKQNTVQSNLNKFQAIVNDVRNIGANRQLAKQIIANIKQAVQKTKMAQQQNMIEETKAPVENDNTLDAPNSNANLDAFPKGSQAPKSIIDVIQSQTFQQSFEKQADKSNLTSEQRAAAQSILFDAESAINNLDLLSSSSKRSFKSSTVKQLLNEMTNSNGDYGQNMSYEIVGRDNKKYNVTDILALIPAVCDNLAKIQGQIDLGESRLKDQKQQESVFTTKIKKKETNKFAISQGSAFRLRACC